MKVDPVSGYDVSFTRAPYCARSVHTLTLSISLWNVLYARFVLEKLTPYPL